MESLTVFLGLHKLSKSASESETVLEFHQFF